MSSNHLHLIDPSSITFQAEETADVYTIVSVDPLLINNDDLVTIRFNSTSPADTDWIGAYSPPTVDVLQTSPIKWGYCNAGSHSTYLANGMGQLAFNLTNLRDGIKFYYFKGDVSSPVVVDSSADVVNFINVNQPLRNRVVATGDPNVLSLLWSSNSSAQPTLKWGTKSHEYVYTVNAATSRVLNSSLCGGVATGFGWRELGEIHTANFSGLLDLGLSGTNISYVFGDAATNDFSDEFTLHVPPRAGTQPRHRPTTIALYADMGVGSSDNSYDTTVWVEQCPPAANTSYSVGDLALRGEIDAVFHSGDISYANGYLSGWDFFLDMISPIAGRVPYLTTVGNHESDWPDTASIPGYGYASGGECGVCTQQLLPMPAPATINQPWWSYDIGLLHLVGMSTEHDFTAGSPQYQWIESDLQKVNRSLTPWVIFSGHRSMYIDSNDCCELGTTQQCAAAGVPCTAGYDVEVMDALQENIEPLLYKYRVNLAFAGHFHNVERQSAVYQNQVVQAARKGADDQGNVVWYHDNPQATVWMVVGTAGNGPVYSSANYTWSERYWNSLFGYALLTATNATHLSWQFINSANNVVVDRMVITQNFDVWVDGGGGGGKHGWNSLSAAAQGGIIFAIVFVGVSLIAAIVWTVRFRRASDMVRTVSQQRTNPLAQAAVAQDSPAGSTKSPMQNSPMPFNVELNDVA